MQKALVVSTEKYEHPVSREHLELLVESGGELVYVGNKDEFLAAAKSARIVLNSSFKLGKELVDELTGCRLIARYGTGVDNIDVEAATARGIPVSNVPDFCSSEVANHTMALLIACAIRLCYLDHSVREGRWNIRHTYLSQEIEGQLLGLVGFGRIARKVSARAHGFGMKVQAHDPYLERAQIEGAGVQAVDLETLLRTSDYVSLHAPLSKETYHLLDESRLRLLKPSAFLISSSRGALVDNSALAEMLRAGAIAGAGLDVLEPEPPAPGHALLGLENVVLTPHCAANSRRALDELRDTTVRNAVAALRGEPPRNVVNRQAL